LSREKKALGAVCDPVLARVFRGREVESEHRGSVAVVDERGRLLARCGDPERPVYWRSAAKPFQVMPLLEHGGRQRYGLRSGDIALMCASHGGEPDHTEAVERLLARGGYRVEDLRCGAHWPTCEPEARRLAASGAVPTALHNNCSGKHAGMLLACRLVHTVPSRYLEPTQPLQRAILRRVAAEAGVAPRSVATAIDGCSLPTFRLPLSCLARGYARLLARSVPGETPDRRRARRMIVRAMTSEPWMVAGTGRFTTDFLSAGGGTWIGKEGAEGVYAVGIGAGRSKRSEAIGIALKIEDGSSRARDAIVCAVLARLGLLRAEDRRRLGVHVRPAVRSVRGRKVGEIVADGGPLVLL
jgi:L-asparaginase II